MENSSREYTAEGFYCEWVCYNNEEEREKAYRYLALWKEFFLKKAATLKQKGDDTIIDRLFINDDIPGTLAIKIEMVKNEN